MIIEFLNLVTMF